MNSIGSVSIGVDIVNITRMSKNIDKPNFINRVFTKYEIDYCKNKNNILHHYAGRFAGKEAVFKALKMSNNKGLHWKDIEIICEETGLPMIILHGDAKKLAAEKKITNIQISISHEKDYAVAFVIAVG
jgi:holo-[acyl-carrier protein] synthase